MNAEVIGFALIAAIVTVTIWFHRPPSSVDGLDPVHQNEPRFHGLRKEKDGDGTLQIKSALDGRVGTLVLDRGRLFEPPGSGEPSPVDAAGKPLDGDTLVAWRKAHPFSDGAFYATSFTPDYYLVDPTLDLGAFAAYRPSGRHTTSGPTEAFETGIRYSPVRLLYGTVAPDALLTRDAAGVGLSFYPPEQYVGPKWHHLGLEVGWVASLSGRSSDGWLAGFSFTINP